MYNQPEVSEELFKMITVAIDTCVGALDMQGRFLPMTLMHEDGGMENGHVYGR